MHKCFRPQPICYVSVDLIENDEDSLVEHIPSLGVLHGLVDVGELDEDVPMRNSPEHCLEAKRSLPKSAKC